MLLSEVGHSHCVLNHSVESKCENSHKHNSVWYLIANDGGWLATTTCFGRHGGHRQAVHTKVDELIQYANTNSLQIQTV
jgi:hypothetical protein